MDAYEQIKNLKGELEVAMQAGAEECAEFNYYPTKYKNMINERGPVETIRALIGKQVPTNGYNRLYEEGRLDLTCEALLLANPQFHNNLLFHDIDKLLRISRHRLKDSGYKPTSN